MRTRRPRCASSKAIERPINPPPAIAMSMVFSGDLHTRVDGTLTTLRRHPRDDLIRIDDVARLAMHAVREVDLQAARNRVAALFEQRFVYRRGTEIFARISVLDRAAVAADV